MDAKIIQKRHHTAETSRQSFKEFNKTKKPSREHVIVFDAIANNQPVTSRKLMILTGLERGNLTRTLFNMINAPDPLVKIVYDAKCGITGKTVHHYSLVEFEAQEVA